MKTRTNLFSVVLLTCVYLCMPLQAITLFEPGYTVETYATYSQSRETRGLSFDDIGFLYVTHDRAGSIWRIAPDGTASEFVSGLTYPIGITWGGGTSFGHYLYLVDSETFRGDVIQVDQDGIVSNFVALSADAPSPIGLDRTGNYEGCLYIGSTGDDRIYRIDAEGNESTFSYFPFSRNGGSPQAIAFDTTANYGGLMYVGTSYGSDNADVSGLFALDIEGNETRFTEELVAVMCIAFAPAGAFNGYMFAIGRSEFDGLNKLWRIDSDGNATEFASVCSDIAFGPDGAMYVAEYSPDYYQVTVSRIYRQVRPGSYYVDISNGSDLNDGLSLDTAFASIQKGIDSAQDGDTVLVNPGFYTEAVNFQGKAITVKGVAGPAGVPVLDNPDDFAVMFFYGEGPNSVLKNFVIRNSFVAVVIIRSSPTISNVTIVDNEYGIEAYAESEPNISNSIFWNNVRGDLYGCRANFSWVQEENKSGPLEGLISHWSFDEGSGTAAYDSVSDNHGTIHGAQWATGQIGDALSFDGVDDYVELPENNPIWLPQNDFTLSVWLYFEKSNILTPSEREVILDLNYGASSDSENELGYNIQRGDGGRMWFQMTTTTNSDENLNSNIILATNTWHHIVALRDENIQAIYVDGRMGESKICTPDLIDFVGGYDDDKVNIGRYTTNIGQSRYHFRGKIDDFCIYDRALSDEKILQLYHSYPLFVDPDNGDYHLLSERGRYWPEHDVWVLDKVTSPCIDSGDPNSDYSSEPLPNGSRINMGAFGGTPYGSMSETPCRNE